MNIFGYLALFGWYAVIVALFAVLPARRAIVAAYVAGWLFLPNETVMMSGIPNFTKGSILATGVLACAAVFDFRGLAALRLRLSDLPMVVFSLSPLASSYSNGLGFYDGISQVMYYSFLWGIPYLLGRAYLNDWSAMRDLAVGVLLGGVAYVPLCLFEMRMSPIVHLRVYGVNPFVGAMDTFRFGGWRPIVFLSNGLELGLWMSAATLAGVWMWRSGTIKRIAGVPAIWVVGVLGATTFLCRSLGALTLLATGMGALFLVRWTRIRTIAAALAVIPFFYITARSLDPSTCGQLVDVAAMINQDRAESLLFRMQNEDILVAKALEQPLWGWGGWGRNRVYNEDGKDISITDGFWVVIIGINGTIALVAVFAVMALPMLLVWRRIPAVYWSAPACAPVIWAATISALFAVDCLFNGMINPVYVLAMGGAVSVTRRGVFGSARPQPRQGGPARRTSA
ncbi:MAG: hypothetical protein KF745_01505 [Phycisphaeraceae bacterium]|nr:hypothetical protein [Phycisphaeraceae bacterium]